MKKKNKTHRVTVNDFTTTVFSCIQSKQITGRWTTYSY